MMVPKGFSISGQVDQRRVVAGLGKGLYHSIGQTIAVLQQTSIGHIVGNGTVVEKEGDFLAGWQAA